MSDDKDTVAALVRQLREVTPEVMRGLDLMRRHLDDDGHDWSVGTAMADVQAARFWIALAITQRPLTTIADTLDGLQREVERLESALHKTEGHPDYEYACTDGPRKAWEVTPPYGEGWERNVHAWGYEGGFRRFNYHEEQYWMRKVTS